MEGVPAAQSRIVGPRVVRVRFVCWMVGATNLLACLLMQVNPLLVAVGRPYANVHASRQPFLWPGGPLQRPG